MANAAILSRASFLRTFAWWLVVAPMVGSPGSLAAQSASDTEALLTLNRRIFETGMLERDPAFLLENSVPEYVVVAPGGIVENRDQVIRGLGAFIGIDSISITEATATISGSTAVVVNRLLAHGNVRIPVAPGPRRVMTVFTKDETGRWKAVARALTPCHPRAIEAGRC